MSWIILGVAALALIVAIIALARSARGASNANVANAQSMASSALTTANNAMKEVEALDHDLSDVSTDVGELQTIVGNLLPPGARVTYTHPRGAHHADTTTIPVINSTPQTYSTGTVHQPPLPPGADQFPATVENKATREP